MNDSWITYSTSSVVFTKIAIAVWKHRGPVVECCILTRSLCAASIRIVQGSASVMQTDAIGESVEVAQLDDGNYFGEVSSRNSANNCMPKGKICCKEWLCLLLQVFATSALKQASNARSSRTESCWLFISLGGTEETRYDLTWDSADVPCYNARVKTCLFLCLFGLFLRWLRNTFYAPRFTECRLTTKSS